MSTEITTDRKQRTPTPAKNPNVNPSVLVIGGGVAGMQAAMDLADAGIKVTLIERNSKLGGRTYQLSRTFPTHECKPDGCCMHYCRECIYTPKIEGIMAHPNITVHLGTEIRGISKSGDIFGVEFQRSNNALHSITVDAVVVATGSRTFDYHRLPEYSPDSPDVISFLELEELMVAQRESRLNAIAKGDLQLERPSDGNKVKRVNILLCVGSRDMNRGNKHCSIVCCTYAIGQAMELKHRDPGMEVRIHYMDLRAAYRGFEGFFHEAEEAGVEFIRGRVAQVTQADSKLHVIVEDVDSAMVYRFPSDLVILAVGQEPSSGTRELLAALNIPVTESGFANEDYVWAMETNAGEHSGIFLTGCVLGPRGIRYSVKDSIRTAERVIDYLTASGQYQDQHASVQELPSTAVHNSSSMEVIQ